MKTSNTKRKQYSSIKKINQREITPLKKQIIDFFPSYYMTLISIIQAHAIGYLFVVLQQVIDFQLINDLTFIEFVKHIDTQIYLMSFGALTIIIIIWFEYMMGSALFRWVPKLPDSIIPFLLGFFQLFFILAIKLENPLLWHYCLGAICIGSFFAYWNMYRSTNKLNHFSNKVVMFRLKKLPILNMIMILSFGITFITLGIIGKRLPETELRNLIISDTLCSIFLLRGVLYWRRLCKGIYL